MANPSLDSKLLQNFDAYLDTLEADIVKLSGFEVYTVIEFSPPIKTDDSQETIVGMSIDPEYNDIVFFVLNPNGMNQACGGASLIDWGGNMINLFGFWDSLSFELTTVIDLEEKFK